MKATWSSDATEDLKALEYRPRRSCIFFRLHEWLHMWSYRSGGHKRHDWLITRRWYRVWGKIPNPFARLQPSVMEFMADEIQKEIDADILNTILKNDRPAETA